MRTIANATLTTLAAVATLALLAAALPAQAQRSSQAGNAANAISDAVQDGDSPYRPPGASADPEQARRERCANLEQQGNISSKQPKVTSSGTATHSAQGRPIPKIQRDQSRKDMQESYKANCL